MKPRKKTSAEKKPDGDTRTGLGVQSIKKAFLDNLFYLQGKFSKVATKNDHYLALAYTVRDRMLHKWIHTAGTYFEQRSRTVCYLSAEYLLGPHLENNLINLGIYDKAKQALKELGLDLKELLEQEEEPGLGNGGLGRLAACYMESMATLEIPAINYGIRYEFGIFSQEIRDGWQAEVTDKWLRFGNPWEIARPEISYQVKLGGRTEPYYDEKGNYRVRWVSDRVVKGTAFDTPILGCKVNTVNLLRLWKAEAYESFDFQAFNVGDYYGAVEENVSSENITKVLYPNDEPSVGKKLRLEQQYFFVSCSLQDMIRLYLQREKELDGFCRKFIIQLNDTHPAVGIAELMRLFVDVYNMEWDKAWEITSKAFAYTNHTLLPEALEKWPLSLFKSILPRHLEIIYEINAKFLKQVRRRFPEDEDRVRRMSIIDESGGRYVRMANLSCIGSSAVNGVAKLHTDLLKRDVLRDFHELWPEKFLNVTNGITPRRFLLLSNPRLSKLISEKIGDEWIKDLRELRRLEEFAKDASFQKRWRAVKREVKKELASVILSKTGLHIDPGSIYDIQVKRIHEYKRQHLNLLHVITLYNRIKRGIQEDIPPRTFIFGGKAAPGYYAAKLIIKLINSIAEVVNNDPDIRGLIKVVFFPNFNVKNGQHLYPAADISEQISTAGKEASGTGNMKFAMNGALTVGTLDGANIEIREETGEDNFFLFGMNADEVNELRIKGYDPKKHYDSNQELKEAVDLIASGYFSPGEPGLFRPLVESLLYRDEYMLLADYESYIKCQERAGRLFLNQNEWTEKSILTTARMGFFASDRSVHEYCKYIWNIKPVHIVF
ncbi:MAG: glycogen/starch/alpha-glucan phosphorylase [Nitrospirae bacterium]|nr:glycogen/starch/alpha-glucan phosphorylase [Nitrospirota bacterium]